MLSGKRSITMSMARALHEHLGIPADVLLQKQVPKDDGSLVELAAERFPLKEMAKRAWIPDLPDLKKHATELVARLLERAGGPDAHAAVPLYRKNNLRRINAKTDPYALRAWCWQVLASANDDPPGASYKHGIITPDFLTEVARLRPVGRWTASRRGTTWPTTGLPCGWSVIFPERIWMAQPSGCQAGRPLLVSPFATTASTTSGSVSCTNWRTWAATLTAVPKPLSTTWNSQVTMRAKSKADEWAQEALIPSVDWDRSTLWEEPTPLKVIYFANSLGIHPAIVAGRIRYKTGNYRLLSQLVGTGMVRQQFPGCVDHGPDDHRGSQLVNPHRQASRTPAAVPIQASQQSFCPIAPGLPVEPGWHR